MTSDLCRVERLKRKCTTCCSFTGTAGGEENQKLYNTKNTRLILKGYPRKSTPGSQTMKTALNKMCEDKKTSITTRG